MKLTAYSTKEHARQKKSHQQKLVFNIIEADMGFYIGVSITRDIMKSRLPLKIFSSLWEEKHKRKSRLWLKWKFTKASLWGKSNPLCYFIN